MSKKRKLQDPYAAREAQRYQNPIPSREFIMEVLAERGGPMGYEQLASHLRLSDEQGREALQRRLMAMEREGQLVRNRRDSYGLVDKMDLVRGRVSGHADGYGFLLPDDGGEDLFLSPRQMRVLMHGDRALVRMVGIDRRGRREGALVEVLERANHKVVGRFSQERGLGFVIPSNKRISQDIVVPADARAGAQAGQIVVVEIQEQPSWRSQAIGKIVEVLGDHMAPGMEVDIAMRTYELPVEWPAQLQDEVAQFDPEVSEAAKQGREDLRHLALVTIDGEDARDFDDAVYCESHGKGWRLLVAIADVSTYVTPHSGLDAEAVNRGNSVYFPGRVIPMLPEVLSNGLCSLNPQVDRLCMVCELIISATGLVQHYRFFEGVMRSHARLSYTEVAGIVVDKDKKLRTKYQSLVPHLERLHQLYQKLHGRRQHRGAIDFDMTETRVVFGEQGKIERIVPVQRNDAHKMIEECMIIANVAAAEYLAQHQLPALYRVHAGPSGDKLSDLRSFLGELGLPLKGGDNPTSKHFAQLLEMARGRPDEHLIQTVLLRSLSQAIYTPENIGHFGLAFDAYTHFTSPIRRHPDLLVHRAIRHALSGRAAELFEYSLNDMVVSGEHCSMTERRADEATRDAMAWLKCEYMQDKLGKQYDGIISGVTSFGIFVELGEIFVEGLVHVTTLKNDYYHYDPTKHRLVGERYRTVYRLGDKVRVKVARVNLDDKKIDFDLVEKTQRRPGVKRKAKAKVKGARVKGKRK